jgi:hypothetical protein
VQYEYSGVIAANTLLSLASRGESPAKAYELVKWLLTEFNLSNEISIRWPQLGVEDPDSLILRLLTRRERNPEFKFCGVWPSRDGTWSMGQH